MDLSFYTNKTVLVTGCTGFKGAWLCYILHKLGAHVVGYSLEPPTNPSLFELAGIASLNKETILADVRDLDALGEAFAVHKPNIAIHMAAQPLVRYSYAHPLETFAINVMGTVHFLEALRSCDSVASAVNVTTDKVYRNLERPMGYRETDALGGMDPYSASKSCSELVTNSYRQSFFYNSIPISTCRAGNVIGGGDFAVDRILPDCIRAMESGTPIYLRNPNSVRPYQHVLEPLFAYLLIAVKQAGDTTLAGSYNIGPEKEDCITTGELADIFCSAWGSGASWQARAQDGAPHEAGLLMLDCAKAKDKFGWYPRWNAATAVEKTVEWSKAWLSGRDIAAIMSAQTEEYLEG